MKENPTEILSELVSVLEKVAGSRYFGNEFAPFMRVGNPEPVRRLATLLDTLWKQIESKNDQLETVIAELKSARNEMESVNTLLDSRVNERTKELAEANLRLETLSTMDALTGIPNRRHFEYRLEQEFSRTKRHHENLSCIMMDIDLFKNVNDTYGHLFGDEVLKVIGAVLRSQLRVHDIYARYGGEEFVVLLPESTLHAAFYVAEKIRLVVAETLIAKENNRTNVTVSLGIAQYDSESMPDKHSLIDAADRALYEAKRTGRNKSVIYNPERTSKPS
ncbi:MAG: GGDEF domain-containing protein [Candidatus Neomarinimicrobiota bacterium]